MLVVATRLDHEQPTFKCQKVVKKFHRMWNWDDIKKRLASGRVAARSEKHRFKLNIDVMWLHWFKKDAIIYYMGSLCKFNFGLSNLVHFRRGSRQGTKPGRANQLDFELYILEFGTSFGLRVGLQGMNIEQMIFFLSKRTLCFFGQSPCS